MKSLKAFAWGNERHRFLIIGAYNTGFGYLVFAALYAALGKTLHYLVIVVLAHILAVTNAFIAQRKLVFRTNGSVLAEFARFNITTVGTLLAGLVGMALLVEQAKMHVLISQALVTGATVILSYFAHRNFTFKKQKPARCHPQAVINEELAADVSDKNTTLTTYYIRLPTMNNEKTNSDISRKVLNGLKWTALMRLMAQIISWGISIVVIRYVKPEDYGLKSMAEISLTLLFVLSSGGMDSAIIHVKDLTKDKLKKSFGLLILINLALFCIQCAAAYPLAEYYHEPRIKLMAQVMALGFLVVPFSSIPSALLSREMNFKVISTATLVANVIGASATFVMALMGFGVWALITGPLITVFLNALIINIYMPCLFLPSFSFGEVMGMAKFGGTILLTGLLGIVFYKADVFIAGRFISPHDVGLYAVAYQLASLPMSKIMPILHQVAFPAYSQLRDSPALVVKYFLKTIRLTSLILMPLSFGLAGIAKYFILAVLGDSWIGITEVLVVLCIVFPVMGVNTLCAPLGNAMGKPSLGLQYSMLAVLMMVPAFIYGVQYGILGLALVWLLVFPWVMLFNIVFVLKLIKASFRSYLKAMLPPFFVSSIMLVGLICFSSTEIIIKNLWITMGIMIFAGAFVYLGGMFVLSKQRLIELYHMRK